MLSRLTQPSTSSRIFRLALFGSIGASAFTISSSNSNHPSAFASATVAAAMSTDTTGDPHEWLHDVLGEEPLKVRRDETSLETKQNKTRGNEKTKAFTG